MFIGFKSFLRTQGIIINGQNTWPMKKILTYHLDLDSTRLEIETITRYYSNLVQLYTCE